MLKFIHPAAGVIALLTILTFWLSTAFAELFGSHSTVVAVKTAIPWGFLVLIPALMAAGGSGFALSKGRRAGLVGAKAKRMPLIAANGILVLIPSALFLRMRRQPPSSILPSMPCRRLNLQPGQPTSHCSSSTCAMA